jgi:hypothetical protein
MHSVTCPPNVLLTAAGEGLQPRHSNRLSCSRAPLTITISLELGTAARGSHRAVSVGS